MSVIPSKMEKCQGAMLASAIGDALGWPNEMRAKNTRKNGAAGEGFAAWTRRCGRPNWHEEKILPGEYSDDTQMILCVARSILTENWEMVFQKIELPYWIRYERGGGGALLRAARACEKGNVLWKGTAKQKRDYFQAGGNGAVMRILPHVISMEEDNLEKLMADVVRDSLITHGHPRAILGASCYAYALYYLLKKESVLEYGELVNVVLEGKQLWGSMPDTVELEAWKETALNAALYDYEKEWSKISTSMIRQLEFIRDSLKKGLLLEDREVLEKLGCFGKTGGAGDVTILSALYLASKYANNPIVGIKTPAFMIGIDTDTIASITGGLLGILSGDEWIPLEWREVQDYDCIVHMTELLLSQDKKEDVRHMVSKVKKQHDDWEDTLIGKLRLIDTQTLAGGKNVIVAISKWESTLGQTLYFKKYTQNYDTGSPDVKTNNDLSIDRRQEQIKQNSIKIRKCIFTEKDIEYLLERPELQKITFKKVLKIIKCLLEEKEEATSLAKKMKVDIVVMETLKSYLS